MLVLHILLAFAASQCEVSLQPVTLALQKNDLARASSLLAPLSGECAGSSSFYALTGVTEELSGQTAEAERAFLKAISLDPKSPQLKEQLGAAYLRNKKPAEAVIPLREAVALDPTNGVAKKYLIGAYVETNSWKEAAALFEQIGEKLSPESDPVLLLWFAKAMIGTRQFKRLDTDLPPPSKALAPGLLFSLGTVFAQKALYQKAIEYLGSITEDHADDAVYFNLGLAYSHLHQYDEARKNYFLAIDKHPDHAGAYFRVGLDYVAAGDPRRALPWLFRAEHLSPSCADVCYALVEQLILLNYNDTAQEVLSSAIQARPDDPFLLVAGADLKQAQGDAKGAAEDYRKILVRHSGFAPALIGLARADLAGGNDVEARSSLLAVLAEDPDDAVAHGELGSLALQEENWEMALNHLTQAWTRDHSKLAIGLKLSRVQRQLNHPDEALRVLKEVRAEMQHSPAYHIELAQVYTQLHQPERAEAERKSITQLQADAQALLPFDVPKVYVH